MPEKVAKLESDVAHIKRDVDELKTDVKAIDKKYDNYSCTSGLYKRILNKQAIK